MKLLIVTPEFVGSGGGIMTFYQALAASLLQQGAEVRVIQGSAFLSGSRDRTKIDGVDVETLETERLETWFGRFRNLERTPVFRRSVAAAWAMWEQVDHGRGCDVVEAADFGLCFLPAVMKPAIPCVMQMHASAGQIALHDPVRGQEMDGVLSLAVETEFARKAAAVQSYSHANAAYWAGQAQREAHCIRPAWKPEPVVHAGQPSKNLAVVGRVQRWKGPHILCEALRLLGADAPQVDWYGRDTIFGEAGTTTSQWLKATYPDVWGKKIFHKPAVDKETVAAVQASALLNIIPSTWDVFNFTAVEALASGRPVICSSGAGASELMTHGQNGFTYAAEDAAALAACIEAALTLSSTAQVHMAEAARATVEQCLDPSEIAQQRIAAYNTAIESAQPHAPVADWLSQLCSASGGSAEPLQFLDHLPIRGVAEHVARRTLRKILQR